MGQDQASTCPPSGKRPPQPSPAGGGGNPQRKLRTGGDNPEDRWGLSPRRRRFARPDQLAERVLFADGLVLVIDKPAGIAVHQGPGGGPHLEHWFPLLRFGLPKPPALAHRLDRDTSGCLVLGRHPKALRRL